MDNLKIKQQKEDLFGEFILKHEQEKESEINKIIKDLIDSKNIKLIANLLPDTVLLDLIPKIANNKENYIIPEKQEIDFETNVRKLDPGWTVEEEDGDEDECNDEDEISLKDRLKKLYPFRPHLMRAIIEGYITEEEAEKYVEDRERKEVEEEEQIIQGIMEKIQEESNKKGVFSINSNNKHDNTEKRKSIIDFNDIDNFLTERT